jgi:hypothetical protein
MKSRIAVPMTIVHQTSARGLTPAQGRLEVAEEKGMSGCVRPEGIGDGPPL